MEKIFKGKTVLLGVTGCIAAYKSAEIISKLNYYGANVQVIMTKNACEFITPLTLETLSKNLVVTDMFANKRTWEVEHISLAQKADICLIAPATANVIGKVSNGIADDMLTTTIMAIPDSTPVVFAPAMNTNMYNNAIVQNNIKTLKSYDKYYFVEPANGRLACGDIGKGKLAKVDTIVEFVAEILNKE